MVANNNNQIASFFKRVKELESKGLNHIHAHSLADLEQRIQKWPKSWGRDLHILVYGDFNPPKEDMHFAELGITLHHEKKTNTLIKNAICVLEATVRIEKKTIEALLEASKRINLLLGIMSLVSWGNCKFDWWCHVTHGGIGGAFTDFTKNDIDIALSSVGRLPAKVLMRIESALYWVRTSKNLIMQSHERDILKTFAGYWNAFECLVEAICLIKPFEKLTRYQKQKKIDEFINAKGGSLTPNDVQECYQNIVNPGFVGKASHALRVCFGKEAERYIEECFTLKNQSDRLYNIRNAINHGEIDSLNQNELFRVESRLTRLWMIIWRMFGTLVRFPAPVDRPQT